MSLLDADWLDPERIPLFKLLLHLVQILLGFVVWCMEIAVFRADGAAINGNNGWTFAVFFLSIPAWVYLVMAPRYQRTQRIAVPSVMMVVDALFAVIWLTAFATQAAYNTANSCGTACAVSKAIVGVAFFVFLFWCLTALLSLYTLKYWQMNTALPGYDGVAARRNRPMDASAIDPDKEAFSTAPHDTYAPLGMNDHGHDPEHDGADPYGAPSPYGGSHLHGDLYGGAAAGQQQNAYGDRRPGSAGLSENPFRQENPFEGDSDVSGPTSYHGAGSSMGSRYNAPTEYGGSSTGPVTFPSANYDRIEH